MTPREAAKQFHLDNPHATPEQALAFAGQLFTGDELESFLQTRQRLYDQSAKAREIGFTDDANRALQG